jgi:hypothetical protein
MDSQYLEPSQEAGENVLHGRWRMRFRRLGFVVLNLWLVGHLMAIVTAPATVGPSSQTARDVWDVVSPYLQVLYLNHGFHYFAPQPGSSHLVDWEVTRHDGSTESGRFPNFDIRPRLMYHRYFMLSEYLGNAESDQQKAIANAFAMNLCREYSAGNATLATVRHDLPTMARIRTGGSLTDEDLYEEQPLGDFQWSVPAR